MFQKNVTLNEDQEFVLSGDKLTANKSSLLILAPNPVLLVNELTAPKSSLLIPAIDTVPLFLIKESA
jgi:hypothetical protein